MPEQSLDQNNDPGTTLGGDPSSSDNWRDSLPDDLKSHTSLQDIKDVAGLAKTYIDTAAMVGKDKLVIPGDDATDEERSAFYSRLGRPAGASDYELTLPKDGPQGLQADKDLEAKMRDWFYKAGMSQKQAQQFYDEWNGLQAARFQEQQRKATEAQQKWEQKLGEMYGTDVDTKKQIAAQAVRQFGGENVQKWFNQTGLGNHPMFIDMFAKIGAALQEGGDPGAGGDSGGGQGFGGMTSQQAEQEIGILKTDQDFMAAYLDGMHPGHQAAVDKMSQLNKIAYPGVHAQ